MNVTIARNALDPQTWQHFECDHFGDLCMREFPAGFPSSARIYVDAPCKQFEVTPHTPADVERLLSLDEDLIVVVYPQEDLGIGEVLLIIALIAAVVVIAVMQARPPSNGADQSSPSPNNELSDRQNSARPNQRIPDIYGTVRSTPDLLMLPYTEYINYIEYEHAYMCIGRGSFLTQDALDDTTPIKTIDGAGVTVYGPFDSPNNTTLPLPARTVFGLDNAQPVLNVGRCTAVNGQDLLTDDESVEIGSPSTMAFTMSLATGRGTIVFSGGENLSVFTAGDFVYLFVTGVKTHHTTQNIHISGTYSIYSVDETTLVLNNVQSVANDWGWLAWTGEYSFSVCYVVAPLALSVGPFFLPQPDQTQIWLNLTALNGMYQLDSSGNVSTVIATFKAIIQPTDVTGNPTGDPYTIPYGFAGDITKITVAYTWKITLTTPGPCTVTLYRSTASPVNSQVVDAVKWKDLLSVAPVTGNNFGNVTTVYSVTKATSGALSVKERKLNLLVTRLVKGYSAGTPTAVIPSNAFIDALVDASLDPFIGNRQLSELDIDNFTSTYAAIFSYFKVEGPRQFCATFDDMTTSFEEIVTTICTPVNCVPFRRGATIQVFFEQQTENSVLLFNHRNKLPNSETRTVTFGVTNQYDCIEYNYNSDVDDSQVTLYFPFEGTNPQKVDSVGVRNYPQAYVSACRAWQKLVYQNTTTVFDATQEAEIVLRSQRVLVADNTRSGTQDGEVYAQNVLELTLSQPFVVTAGKSYTMFLQMIDGSVFSTPISVGSAANKVILNNPPPLALSLDEAASVRTLYWIVTNGDTKPQAFLINDREVKDSFTSTVTAMNYDDRYYLHDLDPFNGTMPTNPDKLHTLPQSASDGAWSA